MTRLALLIALLGAVTSVQAQSTQDHDYFSANRVSIRNGLQAVLMCNGLFTSHRTLEQVFDQELAYVTAPVGTAEGGEYAIDWERRFVEVGGPTTGPVLRAVFREGIGCVVVLEQKPLPDQVDGAMLQAASDWAFDRETPEQDTLSLIVVYKGDIIHERYAEGVTMMTRTRTWSTAKSIAATLIGMLVDDGRLELDAPLGFGWLPDVGDDEHDPRNAITLRHVLNMSSGLYPVDSFNMEYATGSGLAYWNGLSSVDGARNRALIREPGTHWDYENYDTLLAVYAMKLALRDEQAYAEFPRKALLDPLGMRNTLPSTDRFGDFIFSSQVYTTARDLARFGLLYVQNGVWQGERLISEEWIDFVRTPAPASAGRGHDYGGQFWLVPDDRTDVPKSAYATAGNRGQYVIVVPTHDLVIVRRGLDYGKQGFNRWDLTREVLKAFTSKMKTSGQ